VGELGALRLTSRAGGVQNRQSVVVAPADRGLLVGRAADQVLIGFSPIRRVIGDRHEILCRNLAADGIDRIGEIPSEDEDSCPAVRKNECDLGPSQSVVDRHQDGADLSQAEQHVVILRLAQRQQGDAIPAAHPETQHGIGEPVGALVELPEAPPYVLANEPLPLWGNQRSPGHELTDVDVHHDLLDAGIIRHPPIGHPEPRRRSPRSCRAPPEASPRQGIGAHRRGSWRRRRASAPAAKTTARPGAAQQQAAAPR
jgi:hypothetical protein